MRILRTGVSSDGLVPDNTWGRIVSPDPELLWMQAAVWSVATKGPVRGQIVYIPLTDASLDSVKGTLKGKIVLLGEMRSLADLSQPLSYRYTDEDCGRSRVRELHGA